MILLFFIYLFLFVFTSQSFPSLPPYQFVPSFLSIYYFSTVLQERVGLPQISDSQGISSCRETRQIQKYIDFDLFHLLLPILFYFVLIIYFILWELMHSLHIFVCDNGNCPGTVTESYKLPVGAGNWTYILWKSCHCSW